MAHTIYYTAAHLAYLLDLVRKGLETEGFSQMVRAFREFRSERKKRTSSGGSEISSWLLISLSPLFHRNTLT